VTVGTAVNVAAGQTVTVSVAVPSGVTATTAGWAVG
jgi:hypothetical protein